LKHIIQKALSEYHWILEQMIGSQGMIKNKLIGNIVSIIAGENLNLPLSVPVQYSVEPEDYAVGAAEAESSGLRP
jgi:hypothetical protein